jgi:hypothetical protein
VPKVSKDALIRDVERRMIEKYSQLSAAQVSAVVALAHARFTSSRVREFVPLLVEKRVQRELTGRFAMGNKHAKPRAGRTVTAEHAWPTSPSSRSTAGPPTDAKNQPS